MKLRVKFAKYGAMRFVGHLDIMRYFQKAIRRAEIDIAYSGGYSPHQIMSFAAPLGVGLESKGEYMDIEVNSYTTSSQMKDSLNAVMVSGIEIINITMLADNTPNAMASVAAAEYTVRFREGYEPEFDWCSQLNVFYTQTAIKVIKKTKKSEMELDLKPFIYSLNVIAGKNGRKAINMLVDASSSGNIKPSLVLNAFLKANGEELSDFALEITREDTFASDTANGKTVFIPLNAVGNDF